MKREIHFRYRDSLDGDLDLDLDLDRETRPDRYMNGSLRFLYLSQESLCAIICIPTPKIV